MKFVHLHAHTHYSFLDALAKPKDYVKACLEYGMNACAITDHGGLYGAIEFYQEFKANGLRPIIGMDAYVASLGRFDKSQENKRFRLVLLAMNNVGYKNLMKLSTIGHLEGFYYKPRIDDEILAEYSEGLIALSGDSWGEVPSHIMNNDYPAAVSAVKKYQKIFGKDNFYLELQHRPEVSNHSIITDNLKKLSSELGAPLVATNSSRYPTKEDKVAHDAFVCIGMQKVVSDENRIFYEGDYSIASPEYMINAFADTPKAIANTQLIADRCNVDIDFGATLFPHFETEGGVTPDEQLRKLCYQGLELKYASQDLAIPTERLEYELGVIKKMGYATYFLIVHDFIAEARRRSIPVGPGRGSAAGSIISYTLGITALDPLKFGLLFERFLNPERSSMPDIDIDFADNRRDEILDYVIGKYGEDKVAQIITFGTLAPKAAVRDAGRVLGFSYAEVDRLAKLVPMPILGKHKPLLESIENDQELSKEYKENKSSKEILDIALKFEHSVRHVSTHACAVVISDRPVCEYAPLQRATGGKEGVITQYEMNAIADIGLLKMDFLGLRNLTILETAIEIIKRTKGVTVDIQNIPIDDQKTYKLMAEGKTTGIFQFESPGMKRYLKELKPTEFDDLVAMNSLYRPGPMEFIPQYIAGKHNPKSVHYIDDSLKPVLKKTYGVAVYQEQIMELAQIFTGMPLGEAYLLLKGIGKKKAEIVQQLKTQFIEGAISKGHSQKLAVEVFEKVIEPFAGYGFNKSHACCYSWIAYQTAYLKAHYSAEFMAALLSSDPDNTDKVVIGINECEAMGISVLPPNVNKSLAHFTVIDDNTIRFGLTAIKGLGEATAREIITSRADGEFQGIEDFASKVPFKLLNKKSVEALAYSGALDDFGERNSIAVSFDEIAKYSKSVQDDVVSGQTDIFGVLSKEEGYLPTFHLAKTKPASDYDKLKYEKKLLGLYVTKHPLDGLKKYFGKKATLSEKFSMKLKGMTFKVGGLVTEVRKIMTKSGKYMAYLKIEDPTGVFEAVAFPTAYPKISELLVEDNIVILSGKLEFRGKFQFVIESAQSVNLENMIQSAIKEGFFNPNERVSFRTELSVEEELHEIAAVEDEIMAVQENKVITVQVPRGVGVEKLEELKLLLKEHKGDMELELSIDLPKSNKSSHIIKVPFGVHYDDELKKKIAVLFES